MGTWILSKTNGNALEVNDPDLAAQLVKKGHTAYDSDPRRPGAKRIEETSPTAGVPIPVQATSSPAPTADGYPEGAPSETWTVKQLKKYTEAHGIDLEGARTKPEILAVVLTAGEDDDEDVDLDDDELDDEDLDDEDEDDESDAPADEDPAVESKS
jgi:hypothetical protein